MGKRATPVDVSERQQGILKRLTQAGTTGQELAIRARVVLMSAAGTKRLDQAMADKDDLCHQRPTYGLTVASLPLPFSLSLPTDLTAGAPTPAGR